MFEGLTLVVSPLIALMKDQVDDLQSRGVAAARLDSTLTGEEVKAIFRDLQSGLLKILFVAPERLANERFVRRLERVRISMLAVDEAHCISEWGHNFRPDYMKLSGLANQLRVERVLALTATATPKVSDDIRRAFSIAPDDHVQTGFFRPNLHLLITPCEDRARTGVLIERLKAHDGAAIVYVTQQRTAEIVAEQLVAHQISARAYHAGMKADLRSEVQEAFMDGQARVIVATIAFGMGIDKADIRAVYHYNLPKSLEGYAQEIGRAGRDGEVARCEMLGCADDTVALTNFTYGDTPDEISLRGFVNEILSQGDDFSVSRYDLSTRFDMRPLVVATTLTYLELDDVIQLVGPFYSTYKVQPVDAGKVIPDRFEGERSEFLRKVFALAKKGERG